jgi:CubicO group peptidase (beta-lactamase class C family)
MSRWLAALALACVAVTGHASDSSAPPRLDGARQSAQTIDARVLELMAAEQVPGLGLALIHDGKVAYLKAHGLRDVAKKLPLQVDTVMYGASLTKATFAYFVMQLVDEGKIDLDRPLAAYLTRPLPDYPRYADLRQDARWRSLTLRMLLSHTTGFANFRFIEPDRKLRFHRNPGARYGYSGEGILLAQFLLEQVLRLDVGSEMQRRIFAPLGMKRSALTWRDEFAANLAQDYTLDGQPYRHRHWDEVGAAGSLDTTLADWSAFLAAVARGDGLSAKAQAEMVRRQIEIDSETQFPTLGDARTDRWKSIGLGYGLGWGVFDTRYGHAFFKEGHDEGTANYALCIAEKRACILMLSNSVRAERLFATLVRDLFGDVPLPYQWEGYAPPLDAPQARSSNQPPRPAAASARP